MTASYPITNAVGRTPATLHFGRRSGRNFSETRGSACGLHRSWDQGRACPAYEAVRWPKGKVEGGKGQRRRHNWLPEHSRNRRERRRAATRRTEGISLLNLTPRRPRSRSPVATQQLPRYGVLRALGPAILLLVHRRHCGGPEKSPPRNLKTSERSAFGGLTCQPNLYLLKQSGISSRCVLSPAYPIESYPPYSIPHVLP